MQEKLLTILLFEIIRLGNGYKCPECMHIKGHWEDCPLKKNEDWVNEEVSKLRLSLRGE